ncbi:replication protein P [Pasteurellaceae bacterium 22721_9_1]
MTALNVQSSGSVSKITEQGKLPSDIEYLVNRIFEQLLASCPSIQYWTAQQIATAKQQWVLAFAENGIRTIDQVRLGMKALRTKEDDFVPSIGKFISWCNSGNEYASLGLPTAEELLKIYQKYQGCVCEYPEEYPWKNAMEYHLVMQLHRAIFNDNLNTEKTLIKAKSLISDMANYLQNGGVVAQPKTVRIENKKQEKLTPEQTAERIKQLKRILRGYE